MIAPTRYPDARPNPNWRQTPRGLFPTHRGLWTVIDKHDTIHLVHIRYDRPADGFYEGRFLWEPGEVYIHIDTIINEGFTRWRAVRTDAEHEAIRAAYTKRQAKLAKMTSTSQALFSRAKAEHEWMYGALMKTPSPVDIPGQDD